MPRDNFFLITSKELKIEIENPEAIRSSKNFHLGLSRRRTLSSQTTCEPFSISWESSFNILHGNVVCSVSPTSKRLVYEPYLLDPAIQYYFYQKWGLGTKRV
jgi:hypothetical protein